MTSVASVSDVAKRVQRTVGLHDAVTSLRYVTGKRAGALQRLGMQRVRDVLYHFPSRYLDFTQVVPIGLCDVGSEVTVVGRVDTVQLKRPRPRMQLVEVVVVDDTGIIVATFFRQPWIAEHLKPGDLVAISGKVSFAYGFKQMRPSFYEVLGDGESASYARVLPVHPVGEGISASWMRRIVSAALLEHGDVCDFVPAEFVCGRALMGLSQALREMHFPTTLQSAEEARRRLAYDELLTLQLTLLIRREVELGGCHPISHVIDGEFKRRLIASLPFEFSDEQRGALSEILADMAREQVMNRILLGDVGTGKTAVAAVALAAVADTGTQAAMMAPTSVLARQYAQSVGPFLDAAGIRWVLVTGATGGAERERAAEGLRTGQVSIAFGTTALLSDDIEFERLSLVVIDEQHRFGVNQRASLRRKGPGADLLAMTATPIPRTLALSIYGDMSYSRIRHRPVAGAGVSTKVIAPENIDLAYGAVRGALAAGHQAYVICPLVDDADEGKHLDDVPKNAQASVKRLHSATSMRDTLQRSVLRGVEVGLLTGRMGAEEKDRVMGSFTSGEIQVLVSTTVVEVGVDVPNATVMIVFDADRFGLATLHQLRGRVGRGGVSGSAFLCCAAGPKSPARTRLAALESTTDGFELAELDLSLRHEGEILGYRQHGGVSLAVCDFAQDGDLVEYAHNDARIIARSDPKLTEAHNAPLANECRDRYGVYFEEVERT